MEVADFQIVEPLFGGFLIGVSALLLMWLLGRVAGICGIAYGVMSRASTGDFSLNEMAWRILFLLGLIAGAFLFHLVSQVDAPSVSLGRMELVIGGLLVGLGTKLGSGCTSGHGVVGLGRLSLRSLAATITFILFGMISVFVFRHIMGVI